MAQNCWKFMHEISLANCVSAAVQRGASIYRGSATGDQKAQFRSSLKRKLKALGTSYRTRTVSEAKHLRSICNLARQLSKRYARVLAPEGLVIGRAQKALNLYLKYLWCLGKLPEPPHCPFDRKVIDHLGLRSPVAWTKIRTKAEYVGLVACARRVAKRESLAQWELRIWRPE